MQTANKRKAVEEIFDGRSKLGVHSKHNTSMRHKLRQTIRMLTSQEVIFNPLEKAYNDNRCSVNRKCNAYYLDTLQCDRVLSTVLFFCLAFL